MGFDISFDPSDGRCENGISLVLIGSPWSCGPRRGCERVALSMAHCQAESAELPPNVCPVVARGVGK
jgi:hypothetical protein